MSMYVCIIYVDINYGRVLFMKRALIFGLLLQCIVIYMSLLCICKIKGCLGFMYIL